MRRAWTLLLLGLLATCFRPNPPSGAPCAEDGSCPTGLTCSGGACVSSIVIDAPLIAPVDSPATLTDAAVDGAPLVDAILADAHPDAPPPMIDAPMQIDAAPMIDASGCTTFASQFNTCALAFGGDYTVAGAITYNTDTHQFSNSSIAVGVYVAAGAGQVDVVAVHSFTIPAGASLRVIGARPFAIASQTQISIAGTIDLTGGAGSRATCAAGMGISHVGGASGGGGGGFHGSGGAGSPGDMNTGPVAGGTGGGVMTLPSGPLGGCNGGTGGMGVDGAGGLGGGAGGAIYLVAASAVTIPIGGAINAGGIGGGAGAVNQGGGGGGGSGGMILFEGPTVMIAGAATANGGGGGGGAGQSTVASPGNTASATGAQAMGGAAGSSGGPGANGSGNNINGESNPITPLGGGGGGGGGGGFLSVVHNNSSATGSAVISPGLSPWPF